MNLTPEIFVFFLLVFTAVGAVFLFIHLLMGSVLRPYVPDTEKLTIYECGEPTVGSAWVQFDLRYYVIALLFVIFDVEVAFFFPWATVFGKANELAALDDNRAPFTSMSVADQDKRRVELSEQLLPTGMTQKRRTEMKLEDANIRWGGLTLKKLTAKQQAELELTQGDGLLVSAVKPDSRGAQAGVKKGDVLVKLGSAAIPADGDTFASLVKTDSAAELIVIRDGKKETIKSPAMPAYAQVPAPNGSNPIPIESAGARSWATIAFWDIAVFFGVLMVGFAYLWRRGDLNWVKTYEPHQEPAIEPEQPLEQIKTAPAPAPQPVSAH